MLKFLLYYFGILFGLKALGIGEEKDDRDSEEPGNDDE